MGPCWDPANVTAEEWVEIGSSLGRTRFECVIQYKKLQRAG